MNSANELSRLEISQERVHHLERPIERPRWIRSHAREARRGAARAARAHDEALDHRQRIQCLHLAAGRQGGVVEILVQQHLLPETATKDHLSLIDD